MALPLKAADDLLTSATQQLAGLDLAADAVPAGTDQGMDAWLRLTTPTGVRTYAVQTKRTVPPHTAGLVADRVGTAKTLMVVGHVPEATAAIWRARDVHFVDAAGNMYLRWPDLVVDIRGRRRTPSTNTWVASERPQIAFKGAGLKVVFMYLCDPATLGLSVRASGEAAGVAHGTVQNVFRELESTGYLDGGRRTLHRTRELFNQWVGGYILNLSPRLTMARFVAPDPSWWKSSDDQLRRVDGLWGGETAVHHLSSELRPSRAVAYVTEIPRDILAENRFRKADDKGNTEFRHRFWRFSLSSPTLTVPTPLIYADLMASADPRQHEAAVHLRETDELLRRIDSE